MMKGLSGPAFVRCRADTASPLPVVDYPRHHHRGALRLPIL